MKNYLYVFILEVLLFMAALLLARWCEARRSHEDALESIACVPPYYLAFFVVVALAPMAFGTLWERKQNGGRSPNWTFVEWVVVGSHILWLLVWTCFAIWISFA